MMRHVLCLLALFLIPAAAAMEEPSLLDRAEAAYAAGTWEEAERLALQVGGVEGYTLAAESVLAGLMTWQEGMDRASAAREAQEYGERAVSFETADAEAHLRLAAALGYRGRFMSNWRAWFAGIPQDGRDHILAALARDPEDPWAHALYGAWHMEVVRQGGEGTLGASLETGLSHYRSAARAASNEPGIAYHLAIAQLAADPERFAEEAAGWLDQAASAGAGDAFDRAMKRQAAALAATLAQDRRAAHDEAVYRLEH